jgi:vesicle-fusing ATPase
MNFKYKVVPIPTKQSKLLYEDCVFISHSEFMKLLDIDEKFDIDEKNNKLMVSIDNNNNSEKLYCYAKINKNLKDNEIMMNNCHRMISKISLIDKLCINMCSLEFNQMERCEWTIELLKNNSELIVIDSDILENFIKSNYESHIFKIGQILGVKMNINGYIVGLKLKLISYNDYYSNEPYKITNNTKMQFKYNLKNRGPLIINETTELLQKRFDFSKMNVGGLDKEFATIFRKVFLSRTVSTKLVKKMQLEHIKGMLLFGPPGCGKTLIARELSKVLGANEPKIVNGPEILNKYVGESENNIRELFKDAEMEQFEKGDHSKLHVIIFDEIDAICKERGGSNVGTHDNIVNQLLSKIDGVNSLNNILVIGMTNRKDMLDPALLRPGRFEVHMEINLPNEIGREQILEIHTRILKENKMLDDDVSIKQISKLTDNFTGAELAGIVRDARSYALSKAYDPDNKKIDEENIIIKNDHFIKAIENSTPAFGKNEDSFKIYLPDNLIYYSEKFKNDINLIEKSANQLKSSSCKIRLFTLCICGYTGNGKTALSTYIANKSNYPFIQRLGADDLVGLDTQKKILKIKNIFDKSYKSPLSMIILDDIDNIIEWNNFDSKYNNSLYQTIITYLNKQPPKETNKLFIIVTTKPKFYINMRMDELFLMKIKLFLDLQDNMDIHSKILESYNFNKKDLKEGSNMLFKSCGSSNIKKMISVLNIAKEIENDNNDYDIDNKYDIDVIDDKYDIDVIDDKYDIDVIDDYDSKYDNYILSLDSLEKAISQIFIGK